MKRLSPLIFGMSLAQLLPLSVCALESLDDSVLSSVTAKEGIKLRSWYDISAQSIEVFDDDDFGRISFENIRFAAKVNRPTNIDVTIGDIGGRSGIVFANKDLAVDYTFENILINNASIGGIGITNFEVNPNGTSNNLYVRILPGGSPALNEDGGDVQGVTLDLEIPFTTEYETYYEDDGVRLSSKISFTDVAGTGGGLAMTGMTLDVVNDGLQIGLPQISGGYMNAYNAKIGDSVLNGLALRDINLVSGNYLRFKPGKNSGQHRAVIDAHFEAGNNLDYVYIAGIVDEDAGTPNPNEMQMNITTGVIDVHDATVDIDGAKGLRLGFEDTAALYNASTNPTNWDGVRAGVTVENIYLRPAGNTTPIAGLGRIEAQVNLSPKTFIDVSGHAGVN